jgi:hypothetical protein
MIFVLGAGIKDQSIANIQDAKYIQVFSLSLGNYARV